jgi:hypothetical protein
LGGGNSGFSNKAPTVSPPKPSGLGGGNNGFSQKTAPTTHEPAKPSGLGGGNKGFSDPKVAAQNSGQVSSDTSKQPPGLGGGNKGFSNTDNSKKTAAATSGSNLNTDRNATTKSKSDGDKMAAEMKAAAAKNGTAFKSREEAASAFKAKNETKYASTFKSEPKVRPDHIPQTTSVGGNTYNIVYGNGGYGYYSGGRWFAYDVFRDTMMLSMLMNQHSYYYGQPVMAQASPVVVTNNADGTSTVVSGGGGVVYASGPSFGFWFGMIIFIIVVIAVLALARQG